MNTTQDYLPIKDIQNGVVLLKNGDMAAVIETSAVNFGLLSAVEQLAIISSFAGLLNSLSFPIQILIRSKRLNISSYLQQLDEAKAKQTNPLLSEMMFKYRNFVEQIITENEVLDKRFFIIIPLWSYEVGLIKTSDQFQKAMNILMPKRDHILRQLSGIGLEGKQLETSELIELFYDIFNGTNIEKVETQAEVATPNISYAANIFETPQNPPNPVPSGAGSTDSILRPQPIRQPADGRFITTRTIHPNTPFVVEELKDEYGTI